MSLTGRSWKEFEPAPADAAPGAPTGVPRFAPATVGELAALLDTASDRREPVLVWGGGTHQSIGHRVEPRVVVSTARLDRVIDWEAEDLTLVVEGGARVADIESMLADLGQTAGLPEHPGGATVGGVVAAGISGYRRARYGPTRDRILEVTLATGDGRIVKGGGRVVKNVSGYDLPTLAAGSLGALGVIASVCLKLWPLPEASATVTVERPAAVWRQVHRPLAVLETHDGSRLYLQGTEAEVLAQAADVGGEAVPGLHWPDPPGGAVGLSLRIPPRLVRDAVGRMLPGWRFVAQHGVGEVAIGIDEPDPDAFARLRTWAESHGGSLVVTAAPDGLDLDPWGSPPPAIALQRRLVAAFDPLRVVNPGRLPGGI